MHARLPCRHPRTPHHVCNSTYCLSGSSDLTQASVREHADGAVHVYLKILESPSEHDELVQIMLELSHEHQLSADTPSSSPACAPSLSAGTASAANHAIMQTVLCQPAASNTAQKSVPEAQPGTAAEQADAKQAVSKACQQADTLMLPELPMVASKAPPDSAWPDRPSVRKGLGGALSHLTSLTPLPWPLPSWHPNPKQDATLLPPAGAHTPADSPQGPESSQTDESCRLHVASEALASPNAHAQHDVSPSATERAAKSSTTVDPAPVCKSCQPCTAVLMPESPQPLESAQQPYSPGPVPNNNNRIQMLCWPSSIASESAAAPEEAADSDKGAAHNRSVSWDGLQNLNDSRLPPPFPSQTEAPVVEGPALEAPVHVQDAAPDPPLADLKPEQQALLVKGLQLSVHVCQVKHCSPLPRPHLPFIPTTPTNLHTGGQTSPRPACCASQTY